MGKYTNIYGIFGRKLSTLKKPTFQGYIIADDEVEALNDAIMHPYTKGLEITSVVPYHKLSRDLKFRYRFFLFADKVLDPLTPRI